MRKIPSYKSGLIAEKADSYGDNREGLILAQAARIEALNKAVAQAKQEIDNGDIVEALNILDEIGREAE